MPKLTLAAIGTLLIFEAAAQTELSFVAPDSIPKSDSSIIQELKDNLADNTPIMTLDDNDLGDVSAQNISSLLTAGRDPFYNAATFSFSPARFRIRGYNADFSATYINGIPMDNLDNGFTPYGLWGGLNDVMGNRDVSFGLTPNTFAFGEIGSNTNIDSRASRQRAQTSFSYANANRNYRHRWMFSHSTGLNKKRDGHLVLAAADEGQKKAMFRERIMMDGVISLGLIKN